MTTHGLSRRARALEEAFFAEHNRRLLKGLREDHSDYTRKEKLAHAAGIKDEGFLEECLALDIHCETLAALMLVPLIEVSWSDGEVALEEKSAVMRAAKMSGVDGDGPAYRLLESWLQSKPSPALFETWRKYVAALQQTITADAMRKLRDSLLVRSQRVADAAGGFWGFGQRISAAEQAALLRIERALSAHAG